MDKKNLNQVSRDLFAAWDEGVERAIDDAARAEELAEQQLNDVAGMRVESGLRGGRWSTGPVCSVMSMCNLTCGGCE